MDMCPNASVYYVPGLGGSDPAIFKTDFRQLIDTVFGLTFKPKTQEVLPNECNFAMNPDRKLFMTIRNIVYKKAFCDGVCLVWFAHSHGAKMVCDAYKELKRTPVFNKIWKGSAIICIGGASLATGELAQVVLNVEFQNDEVAKGSSNLIGERNGEVLEVGPIIDGSCRCCEGNSHEPQLRQTNRSLEGISLGITTAVRGISGVSTRVSNSTTSGDEEEGKAHYITEYMKCRKWRQRVRQLLPMGKPCCTHSTGPLSAYFS